ncbi:MAG TPA: DUF6152 family protein [Candidatus Acidoferrales bacterium]|jgi:hypothetical protein|nr:DUF6152 family protein [Candidatus Acidoferrales bacterium]
MIRLQICAATVFLAIAGSASAHHGSAMYLKKAIVVKDATVTRFMWQNPHTLVLFDAKDGKGDVVHWAGEAGSTGMIRLLGWSKYSLRPGDVITVYMWPSKFEASAGRIEKIVMDDGRTLKDSSREDDGDINKY